jgi:4-hydroxy-2-oxoheptanedioate aldolase
MIETREAMAIVDDILALEGIDALFVGPSDLSIALFGGAKVDAAAREVDEALKHVVARASAVNKPVALYAGTAERAKAGLAMGARMVTVMSDSGMLRAGAQTALKIARG